MEGLFPFWGTSRDREGGRVGQCVAVPCREAPMSAAEIIELSVGIELECAGLYEVFAKNFQGRAELVYFWKLYAEAERYHAASIRIHQATFTGEGQAAPAADLDAARAFLGELRALRARYEK